MTLSRRAALGGLLLVISLAAAPALPWLPSFRSASVASGQLPAQLTDHEFWRLSESFSEESGWFHSDNFVSNEGGYQQVIPDLVRRTRQGGLYIGVGPEQNFTYIAALRPAMAFILDIRRGNLHEHLLYKALFEISNDRADFVGHLFSRERPAGLSGTAPVEEIFAAYHQVLSSEAQYRTNLAAVVERLTKTHGFALSAEDLDGIDYVYRTAFFAEGPELGYRLTGQGWRPGNHPGYADLMAFDDGRGRQWSYLASDEAFAFMKDLHTRNMLVPVVGDFAGPKALRAIGRYATQHEAVVSAFYFSNVEQYLRQDAKIGRFCGNLRSLPMDATSAIIRSFRGGGRQFGAGMFTSSLGGLQAEASACEER